MKGFVPTPDPLVDLMVDKLFRGRRPAANAAVLDPGCGRGAFIAGVLRWCERHQAPVPRIVGIESNPVHAGYARERFDPVAQVEIREEDFLLPPGSTAAGQFEYIIANPPYVSITALSAAERAEYRRHFITACGRFDLYLLFFEQGLRRLAAGGRLVFITPEKYLYVETAVPLRRLLSQHRVEELHFLDEESFQGLVTYPLVTMVSAGERSRGIRVIDRDGSYCTVETLPDASSWMPAVRRHGVPPGGSTLGDIALRISCGVATGADRVFVHRRDQVPPELLPFARPTIAGREITSGELPVSQHVMLLPYDARGCLLPEERLGALGEYLAEPSRRADLLARTCVPAKPWYAFHETPPLGAMLRPKILCKDIGASPRFVVDRTGEIVPRHSVYYIVPLEPERLDELADYLSSDLVERWLRDHCQRAAKGFLRVQSHVLKQLPVPPSLASTMLQPELEIAAAGAGA